MKDFLSIGKVAKLKNVSIKSLRYYDEIGILKPALTDHTTGYRYYKEAQLYVLDAISLCIELGIPLKELKKYASSDGSYDLQRLLGDAKDLAENRIRSMYRSLETLQNTINVLESRPGRAVPAGCLARTLLSRTVLTIPFDEFTDPEHYNPKLLSLFVKAQQLGLAASYPSGIIYDHKRGGIDKYVFIHVSPLTGEGEDGAPGNWGKNIEGLRTLPSGNYITAQSDKHRIDNAGEVFKMDAKELKNKTVIETDLLKEEKSSQSVNYELQILM